MATKKKTKKTKTSRKPKTVRNAKGPEAGAPAKGIKYGVLKGTVVGGSRQDNDPKSPHFTIDISAPNANGDDQTWHCPVNVQSADKSMVMFLADTDLLEQAPAHKGRADVWTEKLALLAKLKPGFTSLPNHEAGAALDYVREKIVTPDEMTQMPFKGPGANDDLQDEVELYIARAKDQGGTIYVFGENFGTGVHDVHMNQGNREKQWLKDNGIYQDGGIVITLPSKRHIAMLFAFKSQSWNTDKSGDPK